MKITRFRDWGIPRPNPSSIASLLTILITAVQVGLLLVVIDRLNSLSIVVTQGGTTAQPEPIVVARTPDERGQVFGPADAQVTVVEFSDFECPACAQSESALKQLLRMYPTEIRFVFRHFPLDMHSHSRDAAIASECAAQQSSFWEYKDALFAGQEDLSAGSLRSMASDNHLDLNVFSTCLLDSRTSALVDADKQDGEKYLVSGTPTFFVNNEMMASVGQVYLKVKELLSK